MTIFSPTIIVLIWIITTSIIISISYWSGHRFLSIIMTLIINKCCFFMNPIYIEWKQILFFKMEIQGKNSKLLTFHLMKKSNDFVSNHHHHQWPYWSFSGVSFEQTFYFWFLNKKIKRKKFIAWESIMMYGKKKYFTRLHFWIISIIVINFLSFG